MQPQPGPPDIAHKFLRTHPAWFTWVRRPGFVLASFAALAAYAAFLLPDPAAASPAWIYASVGLFVALLLAVSANLMADGNKPETLKMATAFLLIGALAWLFYRYSGAQWGKLTEFFFNFPKLKGNWWILRNGLGVTLMLAIISA